MKWDTKVMDQTARRWFAGLTWLCVALTGALACSPGGNGATAGEVGAAVIAMKVVPDDVACVSVTGEAARRVHKLFAVQAGSNVELPLQGLPLGPVVFSAEAYSSTCELISGKVPSWTGDPVTVTILPREIAQVRLVLRRNGRASVGVEFENDPTPDAGAPDAGPSDTGASSSDGPAGDDGASSGSALAFDKALYEVHAPCYFDRPTFSVTLTNHGPTSAGPLTIAIEGSGAQRFVVATDLCSGRSLGSNESCALALRFEPLGIDIWKATIVAATADGLRASAALQGSAGNSSIVSVTPSSHHFGQVLVGQRSPPVRFTFGAGGLLSVSGDRTDFLLSTQACGTLAPCTVDVTFVPKALGPRQASITLYARNAPCPFGVGGVTVSGTGVGLITDGGN